MIQYGKTPEQDGRNNADGEYKPCPECNGCGCERCGNIGQVVEYWVRDVLLAADFAAKGCLPDAGGVWAQDRWMMQAIDYVWTEQAYWKLRLGIQ